jgi:four helix bundle protein
MKTDLCARTFAFATRIVRLCKELDRSPGVSRPLCNQLLRSGTSIGANVEEGQCGQSRADFVSKMQIACKEARETHYWLRLLVATDVVSAEKLEPLVQESNEIVAIVTTIIKNKRKTPAKAAFFNSLFSILQNGNTPNPINPGWTAPCQSRSSTNGRGKPRERKHEGTTRSQPRFVRHAPPCGRALKKEVLMLTEMENRPSYAGPSDYGSV